MTVNCVIVTYNRVDLLRENIVALKSQNHPIHKIFIIDNCSTDETSAYLRLLQNEDSQIIVLRTEQNIGGAGGFSLGIKHAVIQGCDFVWVMDDDTIPTSHALEKLVEGTILVENCGFIASKVIWNDGTPHKMNVPKISFVQKGRKFFNHYSQGKGYFLCSSASFVSLLIKSEAVFKVGLPISDFFIWGDDTEFTQRITDAGYENLYADNSIVLHKTESNYTVDLVTAPANTAWKFYYEIRNSIYVKKMKRTNKLSLFFSVLNKYRISMHRINKRADGDRRLFMEAVRRGCIDGLKFNPSIEYLPSSPKGVS